MLTFEEGIDIVQEIGQVTTVEAARRLFEEKLAPEQLKRIAVFEIPAVVLKVANAIVMCEPDQVFINTGNEADRQFIRDLALEKGEEEVLPMKGHTIHFDLKEEQGRIIDRTYYVANDDELVSSLGLRMSRPDALDTVRKGMAGIMRGKTMVVGFYARGPAGSPVSNPAIEITSSAYVSHSAEILYRNIYKEFEKETAPPGPLLHQYSQRRAQPRGRSARCPRADGPCPSHHLLIQVHLCRQHPVDEKRQPPFFRGPFGLRKKG
jgi:phosphoenolpyruvate carboxykinase (GTP)